MYEIEFSSDAMADLKWFDKYEQNVILDGIEASLVHEPTIETRNRSKLRPNQTAEWKLRLGHYRVYYDVDETPKVVIVAAIGLKRGNWVYFCGKIREL